MVKRSLIALSALLVLFGSGPVRAQQNQIAGNLAKLGLAVVDYVQATNWRFPPMKTPSAMKKAVLPYAKNGSVFFDPVSKAAFVPNPYFSQKLIDDVPQREYSLILLYDPTSDQGSHYVCLADGHVKKLSPDQWKTLKKASKIP